MMCICVDAFVYMYVYVCVHTDVNYIESKLSDDTYRNEKIIKKIMLIKMPMLAMIKT